jgi:hypothetical protein
VGDVSQVVLGEVNRVLATLLDGLVDLLLLVDQCQCLDDILVQSNSGRSANRKV